MEHRAHTSIAKLLEYSKTGGHNLKLKLVSTLHNLDRNVTTGDINRPGMALFKHFEHFAQERVQIFGKGESFYLDELIREGRLMEIEHFFSYDIPAFIFSYGYNPKSLFLETASKNKIPVLVSELGTSELINRLQEFFAKALARKQTVHGVMMEVFGMGVFMEGDRGVGKSECALELLERGHLFIADDVVDIRLIDNEYLYASSSQLITHHMEITGLGIINVAFLFGVRAIRNEKKLDLVVHLVHTDKRSKNNKPTGKDLNRDILGVSIPAVHIPIQPGTNIPILIETAAMNQRLKVMGYNPAEEFNKKILSMIDKGEDIY